MRALVTPAADYAAGLLGGGLADVGEAAASGRLQTGTPALTARFRFLLASSLALAAFLLHELAASHLHFSASQRS